MNVLRLVFILLFSGYLAGCQSIDFSLNQPFKLVFGGTALNEAHAIELHFNEIIEDSRCPSKVTCVWAGQVSVGLDLLYKGTEQRISLTLGQYPAQATFVFGETDQYRVELQAVAPYPVAASNSISPQDYVLQITVHGKSEPAFCPAVVDPVCAIEVTNVMCVTAPCNPIKRYKTFNNACEAEVANAEIAFKGICGKLEGTEVPTACTLEYAPVCAVKTTPIVCITEPCDPLKTYQTYDNACMANADNAVISFRDICGDLEGTTAP